MPLCRTGDTSMLQRCYVGPWRLGKRPLVNITKTLSILSVCSQTWKNAGKCCFWAMQEWSNRHFPNVSLSSEMNAEVSIYGCRFLAVESFQRRNHASQSVPVLPPPRLIRVHRVSSSAIRCVSHVWYFLHRNWLWTLLYNYTCTSREIDRATWYTVSDIGLNSSIALLDVETTVAVAACVSAVVERSCAMISADRSNIFFCNNSVTVSSKRVLT